MTDREILRETVSDTCRCGAHKMPNNSFCRACFAKLPEKLKKELYKRFGQGYEPGFEAALQFLGYGEQPALFGDPATEAQ